MPTYRDDFLSGDVSRIVPAIKKVEENLIAEAVPDLIALLRSTSSHAVRDATAKALNSLRDGRAVEGLVEVIKDDKTFMHRSTLVWACEAFDCTPHLALFLDLTLKDSYATAMVAVDVIEEMKGPFSEEEFSRSVKRLKTALDNKEAHNAENKGFIAEALAILQEKK